MSDFEAKVATANAISFEAWKWKITEQTGGMYRIPFDVKSEELPEAVKNAPVGTRFLVVLVELNDDETAKQHPRGITDPCSTPSDQGKGSDSPGRKWSELSYAERAGIRCSDERFHTFLSKDHQTVWLEAANKYINETMGKNKNTLVAGETLRNLCGVGSRKDILPETEAAMIFDDIETQYKLYLKYEEQS